MAKSELGEQRRSTLALFLLWEGVLNRTRLASLLGLSAVRASQWIQEFRVKYPRWTVWNSKSRSYHATPDAYTAAKRADGVRNSAMSLAQYLSLVSAPYVVTDAEVDAPVCVAFPDLTTPEPRIFAIISQAIRLQQAVEITYRSMQEPAPHRRTISPHHLVRAGRRWHVRAYCETRREFRDYSLGRIVDVRPVDVLEAYPAETDAAWNAKVSVRLVAHPDIGREQEEVIRFEYFGNTAARVFTCRGALVGYFVQDVRAATDVKQQRPPEYQLAVANIAEVSPWLFP